jgi:hypothetical protein
MKTRDKRSTCKSSCRSRGGVSTRNFERTTTNYLMQVVIFTFTSSSFRLKNFSFVQSVWTKLSEFFLKNFEKRGGMRASCPVAPEQGVCLLRCRDAGCSN